MLQAQRLYLRISPQPWSAVNACQRRFYRQKTRSSVQEHSIANPKRGKKHMNVVAGSEKSHNSKRTIAEQLFPEESKRYDIPQSTSRDVPRLPLETATPPAVIAPNRSGNEPQISQAAAEARALREADKAATGVLVLRCASPNLTEDDFRRLEPRGMHMDGWKLDEGKILKVIPGRYPANLAPNGVYFLLFSSSVSAFTYQGHVTRIHTLAMQNTPSSLMSKIPPPPGYFLGNLDVHAALEAYTLVSPQQRLELRQLKRPFSPFVLAIIQHGCDPNITDVKPHMPFKVRLTLEGEQLSASKIREILMQSGQSRGLSWSGNDDQFPPLNQVYESKWKFNPERSESGDVNDESADDNADFHESDSDKSIEHANGGKSLLKHRTPGHVFVVGFPTKMDAHTFIAHWHKRPMQWPLEDRENDGGSDRPPIANVQMLW